MSPPKPRKDNLPIALTMGDPAGISTEITLAAWRHARDNSTTPFFVLSRLSLFEKFGRSAGFDVPVKKITAPIEAHDVFPEALPVLELPEDVNGVPGKPDPSAGQMTIHSISQAVDYIKSGEASAIVTNPINKHVLYEAGFRFPGHTEFLADLAQKGQSEKIIPVMMLASRQLRTVPLTIHISLEEVPELITRQLICDTARIVSNDLQKYFAIAAPRLAVAGLNPHAGESGAMGRTELDIIAPAIATLKKQGLDISGPYPADTLFHAKARENYDVVIGMYHDQALIPIKTLAFDEGVNTTLGLPFARTSPDHGTAYDIAGKGLANPASLIEALKLAQSMSDQARQWVKGTKQSKDG